MYKGLYSDLISFAPFSMVTLWFNGQTIGTDWDEIDNTLSEVVQ